MTKETQKILFAVLRVFVEDMARGNDNTLHAQEITNQVCKALHRRKEKEKKNAYAFVVTALRALKAKRVLFEVIDDWSDDRLARPKAVDKRSAFGLTRPAIEYLTDEENLAKHSAMSDNMLAALLTEFGLITPKQKEISTVPAVLVETVAAITQEEFPRMPEQNTTPAANNKDNVRRLIATVRNHSETWGSTTGTPADLLGAMCAFHFDTPDGDKTPISAQKLNFGWHNYTRCRDFLKQHGLIKNFSERRNPYSKTKMKAHGIRLTALGLDVAVDGDFKDERPTTTQKRSPMLKDHKRQPEPPPSPSNLDSSQLAAVLAKMAHMEQEIAELRAGKAAAVETPVETPPAAAAAYEYADVSTVSIVLVAAIPNLVTAIKELLDSRYLGPNDKANAITQINTRGLYLSITEIEKALNGIKVYVSQCLRNNVAVDIELLEQYAADFREAAKNVKTKKTLPILGTKIEEKCVLRQSDAVAHPLWKRAAPARV
jgi:hypothetical protein